MNNRRLCRASGTSLPFLLSFLLYACGGAGSSPPPQQNPVPIVQSVSPATVTVGGSSFTLTVLGSNFVAASVVQWNGVSQPTTYVDIAHLTATIPASAITASNVGNLPVTVATPPPGGGNSNSMPVLVEYPLPSISSLNPGAVLVGSTALTLTVNGTSFVTGATLYLREPSDSVHKLYAVDSIHLGV